MFDSAPPPVTTSLKMHRDAVDAIVDITDRFDRPHWNAPTPCSEWNATDLAGHVLTVPRMWHDALDAAESGEWPFAGGWEWIMKGRNEERLAELPSDSGPNRISTFVELAGDWLQRTSTFDPDRPMPGPLREVSAVPSTVGLFTWFTAAEWHVHAWDFAQLIGESYRTPHAPSLYEATITVFGLSPRDGDRWDLMLKMMGRQPTEPAPIEPEHDNR